MTNLDIFFSEKLSTELYTPGVANLPQFLKTYQSYQNINLFIFILFVICIISLISSAFLLRYAKNKAAKFIFGVAILAFIINLPIVIYTTINSSYYDYILTYNPEISLVGLPNEKVEIIYAIEHENLDDIKHLQYIYKKDFSEALVKKENNMCKITLISNKNKTPMIFNLVDNTLFKECL